MRVFCSKPAMLLAFTMAFVALGTQAVDAQQADASASAAADSSSTSSQLPDASAPVVTQLNEVPPPPDGKGQVVFYRVSRLVGMALSYSVHEGDKGIGKLTNGSYFVQVTDPGDKEYAIGTNNLISTKDSLRLEVDEGETYYVVQSFYSGLWSGGPNLTPSSEEAFQEKKLKLSTAVPTDVHRNGG